VVNKSMDELADLVRRVLAQFGAPEPTATIALLGARGAAGMTN
jgi:hypothetical protein